MWEFGLEQTATAVSFDWTSHQSTVDHRGCNQPCSRVRYILRAFGASKLGVVVALGVKTAAYVRMEALRKGATGWPIARFCSPSPLFILLIPSPPRKISTYTCHNVLCGISYSGSRRCLPASALADISVFDVRRSVNHALTQPSCADFL